MEKALTEEVHGQVPFVIITASYYVTTFAQTTGKTHIYTTKNIEKGPWKAISFSPSFHDHTLFFDDDGKVYMIYGDRQTQVG